MGGKSTLLRSIGLAVYLAQIGCPVPARFLRLTLFEGLRTRVGAGDNAQEGCSTFMTEMLETAQLLNN